MLTAATINDVRIERARHTGLTWGLVPTMGFLHEGHLSLVRRARNENDRVGVSIYVNPSQFAPSEDLDTYPRNIKGDLALLEREQVDLVFVPSDDEIYPESFQTFVIVEEMTQRLEGASRPEHFKGVTTVVAKLINIFQPHRAYFGQKDAQQSLVLKRMVADLNLSLELIVCPIVRESDGLAMSSRNNKLSPDQRSAAVVLYHALTRGENLFQLGERNAAVLRDAMAEAIEAEPLARLDYVSVADSETLTELTEIDGNALFSMAVFFGDVRLIDNLEVNTYKMLED